MKRRAAYCARLCAVLALAFAGHAVAGRPCETLGITPQQVAAAAETAMRTVQALDAMDAPVAVVARVGRDLSKQGLVYSHAGFAVRDHPAGRWSVVHVLNQCDSARSDLYVQGLVNFFSDDLVNQDARILWLRGDLADRLAARLRALPAQSLHEPRYNLIARPGSLHYQNSTAWMLELLASVVAPAATDRRQAYAFAERDGFTPDRVRIAYSRRVLGGMFSANTVFTDHPVGTRLSGDYPVVTVRSILRYLSTRGYVAAEREWRKGVLQASPGPA